MSWLPPGDHERDARMTTVGLGHSVWAAHYVTTELWKFEGAGEGWQGNCDYKFTTHHLSDPKYPKAGSSPKVVGEFQWPTYRAGELEGLGGRGEAGGVDGVRVQPIVPLSQQCVPIHIHPRGLQCLLYRALHCAVIDAGDDGCGRVLYQVDAGTPDPQVQEGLHSGVCVNWVPIDDDVP